MPFPFLSGIQNSDELRNLNCTTRFTESDFDLAPGNHKTMCLVDSGIAFNSPYPTILRPERKVEIILSFDFSQRDGGDKELPFKVSNGPLTVHRLIIAITKGCFPLGGIMRAEKNFSSSVRFHKELM